MLDADVDASTTGVEALDGVDEVDVPEEVRRASDDVVDPRVLLGVTRAAAGCRRRGGLGRRARVGLVEARALEGDADGVDHLAQPRLAALRTHRQGVVGERLADVEGVTALLARVGVGGHR